MTRPQVSDHCCCKCNCRKRQVDPKDEMIGTIVALVILLYGLFFWLPLLLDNPLWFEWLGWTG